MRYYDQGSCHGFSFSARETYDWAHKPSAAWPCSKLSDRPLYCAFDRRNGDLVEIKQGRRDYDGQLHELEAFLTDKLGTAHPDSTWKRALSSPARGGSGA